MRLLPLLLLLVVVASCLPAAVSAAGRRRRQAGRFGSACTDAAGRTGSCVSLRQCPDVLQAINGGGLRSQQAVRHLRQSQCGRQRTQLLFCCASGRPAPGPAAPRPQTAVSPDRHPNRAIVERGFQCGTYFTDRVVGGAEVPVGKYPWLALLGYSDRGAPVKFECGGALISERHVLTAAHCVSGLPRGLRLTTVRLGEHDLREARDCQRLSSGQQDCSTPQEFRVARVMVHESFNRPNDRDNDIAILKLDRPVAETHFVGKVCLPFGAASERSYSDVNLFVAGFGRTGPSELTPNSPVLNEVRLPGLSQQKCNNILRSQNVVITSKQICAGGEPGRDSCAGDSGGPLMAATPTGPPYSIIGVVSYGASRCGEGGIPSVNTRVSEYMNWILDRVDD